MEPSKFDELTKALATSTSRRQALRRIAGTLTGVTLASLLPGHALADNSACAHFCDSVFGADTPAAMQCISDAAHHKGLCYTCGPGSGSTKPICCPTNGSGYCSSYSSASCCTSGQGCCSGTCTNLNTTSNCGSCGTTCTGTTPACCSGSCKDLSNDVNNCGACGTTCSSGQTCQNGTCVTPTTTTTTTTTTPPPQAKPICVCNEAGIVLTGGCVDVEACEVAVSDLCIARCASLGGVQSATCSLC